MHTYDDYKTWAEIAKELAKQFAREERNRSQRPMRKIGFERMPISDRVGRTDYG